MSRNSNFFMVPKNWRLDQDVLGLNTSAQLLFLSLVELCDTMGNGGVMTHGQVLTVSKAFARGRQCVSSLFVSGALTVDSPSPEFDTPVRLAHPDRWLFVNKSSRSIPAAKADTGSAKSEQTPTRAPARVKTDRQTDRESIRSPSGSDRMDSARAAPRGAGGAARPAPDAGSPAAGSVAGDDDPKMTRAEAIAAARKAIREGQANSPHCTGRDTVFSRYDPNRPIIPLTSGFSLNGDSE